MADPPLDLGNAADQAIALSINADNGWEESSNEYHPAPEQILEAAGQQLESNFGTLQGITGMTPSAPPERRDGRHNNQLPRRYATPHPWLQLAYWVGELQYSQTWTWTP
ncbi:hypothetical protein GCM10011608_34650 [Micromonospora sonchi]|uniref:Uncharacterized protein n=1 Tax=Micromonospora sonchi TaxID=1763543 RepID=A0A917TZW4_9ACTN|nr:hypothetical protein GCM10011608_34650 [Micromonospora sonchi]